MAEELFTIGEVAERVNRRPQTIRNWDCAGVLPARARAPYRNARGHRLWTREALERLARWIEEEVPPVGHGLIRTGARPAPADPAASERHQMQRMREAAARRRSQRRR